MPIPWCSEIFLPLPQHLLVWRISLPFSERCCCLPCPAARPCIGSARLFANIPNFIYRVHISYGDVRCLCVCVCVLVCSRDFWAESHRINIENRAAVAKNSNNNNYTKYSTKLCEKPRERVISIEVVGLWRKVIFPPIISRYAAGLSVVLFWGNWMNF